jgi:hypothetical protein
MFDFHQVLWSEMKKKRSKGRRTFEYFVRAILANRTAEPRDHGAVD